MGGKTKPGKKAKGRPKRMWFDDIRQWTLVKLELSIEYYKLTFFRMASRPASELALPETSSS